METSIQLIEDTEPEKPIEIYHWRVEYDDGSGFNEYDDDGKDHSWSEIASSRVRTIILMPQFEGVSPRLVQVPEGMTPYMTHRRRILLDFEQGKRDMDTVYIIGWHKDDLGTYLYCFSNGATILSDDNSVI